MVIYIHSPSDAKVARQTSERPRFVKLNDSSDLKNVKDNR